MHANVGDKLGSGMFSSFLELERIEVMRDFSAHRCAADQPILGEWLANRERGSRTRELKGVSRKLRFLQADFWPVILS